MGGTTVAEYHMHMILSLYLLYQKSETDSL